MPTSASHSLHAFGLTMRRSSGRPIRRERFRATNAPSAKPTIPYSTAGTVPNAAPPSAPTSGVGMTGTRAVITNDRT